jgi:protein-disulfide isomerase
VANKPKRPRFDLQSAGRRRDLILQISIVVVVAVFAVGLIGYIVSKKPPTGDRAVQVTSSKLITQDQSNDPKVVMTFYEDFLCPGCGHFERTFGPTVSKLIDGGAIAADYHMVGILDSAATDNYSSRAGAAAYCVADESTDAFRRFHTALFTEQLQPDEVGGTYPDNARLIEIARQAGVAGHVPDCINSGKYTKMVSGMAKAAGIRASPTIRINGNDWRPSSPEELVAKIKTIVGDVPGLDSAAAKPAS